MNHSTATALLCTSILLTGCLEKELIVEVPDAENILFASNGDLLVTGGNGVFQVEREIDANGTVSYDKRPLFSKFTCNFTGLAQHGDWVFTSCVELKWLIFKNNHLFAANISELNYEFQVISPAQNDPLDRLAIPNGMTFAPGGELLIADENFFANSGVARVSLNFDGEQPEMETFEQDWIGLNHGLSSANGVKVAGDYLYLSDGNQVKRFRFSPSGEVPVYIEDADGYPVLNQTVMWEGVGAIVDDILPYCGGVALTSYLSGRLHYVAAYTDPATGTEHFPVLYSSPLFGFDSPSALAIGQAPWFDGRDLLVTEKGIIFDHHSDVGNQLTRSPLSLDLADPDACAMIQMEAESRLRQQGKI